jgi:hypothetical protein
MPTLRRNGAHRPVAAKLAEAREIFQPLEPKSGSSGWGTHVRKVCLAVYQLRRHYEDREAGKGTFTRWSSQTRAVMSEEQHDQWHLLIHYGVQELLYFLYKCLVDLIHQGHREKAAEVLVRGCFYFISQTTMADCPHCL